jgi:membrane protein DedA with SNARE-associated domain
MTGVVKVTKHLQNGVHDPVHFGKKGLGYQHDFHYSRVTVRHAFLVSIGAKTCILHSPFFVCLFFVYPSSSAQGLPGRTQRRPARLLVGLTFTQRRYTGVVDAAWITELVASPWLFPLLFALVVVDAFLVIVPSETAVVALAAVSGATGNPSLVVLILVATCGAIVGDSLCYFLGRRVGFERWEWQRRGRLGSAIDRARSAIHTRPAVLIFTARYVPFARIAVNTTAGAARVPYGKFLPLSVAAGCGWALYNSLVGMYFGRVLSDNPVAAILISVAVAITLGVIVDAIASRLTRLSRRH